MNFSINNSMRFIVVLFSLLLARPNQAVIIQTDSITSVIRHIADDRFSNNEIMVVFDIDNTLGENCWELGGFHWYQHTFAQKIAAGLSQNEAEQEIFALVNSISPHTSLRLLESCTPSIVRELQAAGIITLAATGRTQILEDHTIRHFTQIGLDFTGDWRNDCNSFDIATEFPVHHKNGILFCGHNKKGAAILQFLKHHEIKPKKIILIDDLLKYVKEFDETMTQAGIECVALHYTLIEKLPSTFDAAQSAKRLEEMLAKN